MKVYTVKNLNGEYGVLSRDCWHWSTFLSDASLFAHLEVLQDNIEHNAFTQPVAIVECELKEVETLPNDEFLIETAKKILREHHIAFEELAK